MTSITLVDCIAEVVRLRPHVARYVTDIIEHARPLPQVEPMAQYILNQYWAGRCRLRGEFVPVARKSNPASDETAARAYARHIIEQASEVPA